jgi:hypothetical protein
VEETGRRGHARELAHLSAWTAWAYWWRLSRRENCLKQWEVKGRSQVCFLQGGRVKMCGGGAHENDWNKD